MNLRKKILWACSPPVAALMIVSAIATIAALRLGRMPGTILSANFRTIDAVYQMRAALDDLDRATEAQTQGSVVRFSRALETQSSNITESGEARLTRRLIRTWSRYRATLSRPERPSGARRAALARDRVAIHSMLSEILRLNMDAMVHRTAAAAQEASRAAAWVNAIALLAAVSALLATAAWLRRLLRPLKVVDRGVQRVAAGDFDARLEVDGGDEIAALARSFNEMADKLAAYRNSSLGELLRARRRLEAVMDSLPDALVLYGLDGAPLLANRSASSLLPGGWSGRPSELPEPLRDAVERAHHAVRADREPYVPASVDGAVELPGGEQGRWWLVAAHPVEGGGGKLEGISLALRDVSRARRAADFRGDLVATAAHELRTPLTSLRMAILLCLEQVPGPLNAAQLDLVETARQDCERLHGLVDELLELARLEAGAVRLDVEERGAAELVAEAADRVAERVAAAGTQLDLVSPTAVPPVRVDPDRVRSVFDNLLENALRHASEGARIEIGVAEAKDEVRFWVRDHGPGIPEELREHVFDKFVRVPGTPKRGSGLGLSIVRDIVRAHGGRCGVDEPEGGGARFWFTLPRADVG